MNRKKIPGIQAGSFHFVNFSDTEAPVELCDSSRENIIFGAGHVGGEVLDVCTRLGVPVTAFCDNNPGKTLFNHLRVALPEQMVREYPRARFLIATSYLRQAAEQLTCLGVTEAYSVGFIAAHKNLDNGYAASGMDLLAYILLKTCLSVQRDFFDYPEKIGPGFALEFMLTQRCSLKCKDCSNLMGYYAEPRHYPIEQLKTMFEVLHSHLDHLPEVRLIGGEPLLHPQFHELALMAAESDKVDVVTIATNGTVLPRDEQLDALINDKVIIKISDYGKLSVNRERLVSECDRRGIHCIVLHPKEWNQWGLPGKQGLSAEEIRALFLSCNVVSCLTVMDGRLYHCEHAAHGTHLGGIPDDMGNYVELFPSAHKTSEIGHDIWRFVYEKSCMPACDYCFGSTRQSKQVEPAIQI